MLVLNCVTLQLKTNQIYNWFWSILSTRSVDLYKILETNQLPICLFCEAGSSCRSHWGLLVICHVSQVNRDHPGPRPALFLIIYPGISLFRTCQLTETLMKMLTQTQWIYESVGQNSRCAWTENWIFNKESSTKRLVSCLQILCDNTIPKTKKLFPVWLSRESVHLARTGIGLHETFWANVAGELMTCTFERQRPLQRLRHLSRHTMEALHRLSLPSSTHCPSPWNRRANYTSHRISRLILMIVTHHILEWESSNPDKRFYLLCRLTCTEAI